MILSQRRYAWNGATLEQQRALAPTWILRRCLYDNVFEDERPLKTLGRDVEPSRARISIVVRGRVAVFAHGQSWELEEGDAIVAAPLSDLYVASVVPSSVGFELDWEMREPMKFASRMRLGPELFALACEVSDCLSVADRNVMPFSAAAHRLFERLTAEGFVLPSAAPLDGIDHESQLGVSAIDAMLNDLRIQPQMVDLEARLGSSRWTLTRSLHKLSESYGLRGLGGSTDWRSIRAFARLRVAGLLMTHPRSTTRGVAEHVGYRSAEAMCHAFAKAGLPSPGSARGARLLAL